MSDPREIDRRFEQALQMPAGERAAWLRTLDQDQARRIERLLALYEADSVLDYAIPVTVPEAVHRIGPFEVVRTIGDGGMAIVYLARHPRWEAPVALKLVRPSFDSPHLRHRLQREAEALRRLEHPGICRLLDAGEVERSGSSMPYLAMEYVKGLPLTRHADAHGLADAQRLELMARVCEAVHHAHEEGVVHRDLKPSNVLVVTREDDPVGQPIVLDFGVARLLGDAGALITQTRSGALIGTLAYMSPEQVKGDGSIDARADVYALGVVLFELLTGHLPYRLTGLPLAGAARIIQEQAPRRPGTVHPRFRGATERVLSRALEKDPAHRYPNAAALADELRRLARGQPVVAQATSLRHQALRFARRNRVLSATLAGTGAALTIGLLTTLFFALGERAAHRRADQAVVVAETRLRAARLQAAARALASHDAHAVRSLLDTVPSAGRDWTWRFLEAHMDASDQVLVTSPFEQKQAVLAFGPDDGRLAFHADRHLATWELASEQPGLRRAVGFRGAIDPLGQAFFHLEASGALTGIDLANGLERPLPRLPRSGDVVGLAFGGMGDRLLALTEGAAFSVDLDAGAVDSLALQPGPGDMPRMDAAGRWLSMAWDGGITLWDLSHPGSPPFQMRDRYGTRAAAIDPAGERMAWPDSSGRIGQWALNPGARPELELRLGEGLDGTQVLAYSPDGQWLATGGLDRVVRVYSTATGELVRALGGHEDRIQGVTFSHRGDRLASVDRGGSVRLWTLRESEPGSMRVGNYVYAAAIDPSGERLFVGNDQGELHLFDARSTVEAARRRLTDSPVAELQVAPDGSRLAFSSIHGQVGLLDLGTGEVLLLSKESSDRSRVSLAFDLSGERLVTSSQGGLTTVLSLDGHERARLESEPGQHSCIRLDPTGQWLARIAAGDRIELLDAATLTPLHSLAGHQGSLLSLAFSPDGERLASASLDETVRLWSIPSGEPLAVLRGHSREVFDVAWFPDGAHLVSAGFDRALRIWDARQHEELAALRGHLDYVYTVAVTADGESILSAGGDGMARLWSPRPPREQARDRALFLERAAHLDPSIPDDSTLSEDDRRILGLLRLARALGDAGGWRRALEGARD